MQVKDYQTEVLASLSGYLQALAARRAEAEEISQISTEQGPRSEAGRLLSEARDAMQAARALPLARDNDGNAVAPAYVARKDGLERPVPNICLKVPTGGGKTLLRSGGRAKLLEKGASFTQQDVEQQLCVMRIMLQAGSVKVESKERAGRCFKTAGSSPASSRMWTTPSRTRNCCGRCRISTLATLRTRRFRIAGLTVKQSRSNVLRLVRPLVVIDEGHKAYTNTALDFIATHNPRFILELSATPNIGKEFVSNVLVNVTGTALKNEQIIKLPINLINEGRAD